MRCPHCGKFSGSPIPDVWLALSTPSSPVPAPASSSCTSASHQVPHRGHHFQQNFYPWTQRFTLAGINEEKILFYCVRYQTTTIGPIEFFVVSVLFCSGQDLQCLQAIFYCTNGKSGESPLLCIQFPYALTSLWILSHKQYRLSYPMLIPFSSSLFSLPFFTCFFFPMTYHVITHVSPRPREQG